MRWRRPAGDPRETREKTGGGGGRENLNNRTVLGVGKVVMGAEAK